MHGQSGLDSACARQASKTLSMDVRNQVNPCHQPTFSFSAANLDASARMPVPGANRARAGWSKASKHMLSTWKKGPKGLCLHSLAPELLRHYAAGALLHRRWKQPQRRGYKKQCGPSRQRALSLIRPGLPSHGFFTCTRGSPAS